MTWKKVNLIDNLVKTVKGYAKHDKTTLEEVTEARSGLTDAETVKENAIANKQLTGTLKNLFAVAENYPDLKAESINIPDVDSNTGIFYI